MNAHAEHPGVLEGPRGGGRVVRFVLDLREVRAFGAFRAAISDFYGREAVETSGGSNLVRLPTQPDRGRSGGVG